MNKEFEKLKKENKEIRDELEDLIGLNNPTYSVYWTLINELIENELKQEEFCNQ